MRYLFTFALCCLPFLSLSLNASEFENPLQGSLRDPWQVVTGGEKQTTDPSNPSKKVPHAAHAPSSSRTETSSFGPSFADFQLQYESQLDLSTLEDQGADSVAHRYALGEKEWDNFHPSQQIVPAGTIFYGDLAGLATKPAPPTITIDTNRWPTVTAITLVLVILLLPGAYFWIRHQRNLQLSS